MLKIYNYVFICVGCVYVSVQEGRPEEGVRSLRAGITGSCELPDVGAGNRTRVLQ